MNDEGWYGKMTIRKRKLTGFALLLGLCLALLCGAAAEEGFTHQGEFTGNEQVNSGLYMAFLPSWIYDESTLPDYVFPGHFETELILRPKETGGSDEEMKVPDRMSVEWLSGSEALRDQLLLFIEPGHHSEQAVKLRISETASRIPGEAKFLIRLGAGELYYERDYTLRVVSWEEYPLFTYKSANRKSISVKQSDGGPFEGRRIKASQIDAARQTVYSEQQLISMIADDCSMETAAKLLSAEELEHFSYRNTVLDMYLFDGYSEDQVQRVTVTGENSPRPLYQGYVFWKPGDYHFNFLIGNAAGVDTHPGTGVNTVNVRCLSYSLEGPESLAPGASAEYRAADSDGAAGRSFTLRAEGEGAEFDPTTGILTVSEDAPEGTVFTVTAKPSDGGPEVSAEVKVSSGLLGQEQFRSEAFHEGFSVPVPADEGKYPLVQGEGYERHTDPGPAAGSPTVDFSYRLLNPYPEFLENDGAAANRFYDEYALKNTGYRRLEETEQETVQIDGHPARAIVTRVKKNNAGDISLGAIFYIRNNQVLRILVKSTAPQGLSWEELPKVTMADLRRLCGMIGYDPSGAGITAADGALTITADGNAEVLAEGKKLQLAAVFASPEKVNAKAKNNTVEWTVLDAETGGGAENVKIDKKGVLTAGKKLEKTAQVKVVAASPVFHTQAEYSLTLVPAAKGIAVEPETLTFYTGESRTETVRTVITPDTVPPLGITWQAKPEGIVEITADGDGSFTLKPLKAGKATVTVKEPGGKTAKLTANVLEPVESVQLKAKGKAKAGGTVTVTAELTPKKAGSKDVEWSLDVGEEIATISEKGQLKIRKGVPDGTVITVTCRALGAPEPVGAALEITVGQ